MTIYIKNVTKSKTLMSINPALDYLSNNGCDGLIPSVVRSYGAADMKALQELLIATEQNCCEQR